ncbi:glycerophosphodiester phosphodiesterase [Larkinella sp.]|uniref:glycerophosphodiester phosphodiesterase n=1 Tax=Larkinella sp. TaxID=2034517 RepID=UPI003BAD0477
MNRFVLFIISCLLLVSCNAKKDPVTTPVYDTKIIAHRGAWKVIGAPQNSIAALQKAIQLGCWGSEFDVQMAADSVLFINHDANFQGVVLETSSSTQLSALKLSNGEPLPTLQAYLAEGTKQAKTRLVLEIKSSTISKDRSIATARKVVQLVKKMNAQVLVDYISFDYEVCKTLIVLDPAAHVAYLNGDKTPDELAADQITGLNYYFGILILKPDWIPQAHQKNLTVNVWTVNDQLNMKWFLDQKVDFITTDEPELLRELLN